MHLHEEAARELQRAIPVPCRFGVRIHVEHTRQPSLPAIALAGFADDAALWVDALAHRGSGDPDTLTWNRGDGWLATLTATPRPPEHWNESPVVNPVPPTAYYT